LIHWLTSRTTPSRTAATRALGTGVDVRGRATVDKLRAGIAQMLTPAVTRRAEKLGALLRTEDRTQGAADVIESHLAR